MSRARLPAAGPETTTPRPERGRALGEGGTIKPLEQAGSVAQDFVLTGRTGDFDTTLLVQLPKLSV